MGRPLLYAWHFLTALPITRADHEPSSHELARSMRWYPVVGAILGVFLVAADGVLSLIFADLIVSALLILVLVLLTRGLHQDGLADSLDGMLGGHTPDERLAIMRDPRIGAFGATGLVLTLGLKYLGLVTLPDVERAGMLLCMPVLGRWAMVVGASAAPYARKEGGLAAPFVSELTIRDVVWAAVPAAAAAVFFVGPWVAIPSLALAALTGLGFARLSKRLCGGITGDTLGATNELAEILFLLMAPVFLALP